MPAPRDALGRMISVTDATDAAVTLAFAGIPALLDQAPALIVRGRFLDCECLLGPIDHPFHASIRQGRIVDLTPAPVLMRSWRVFYCPPPLGRAAHWHAAPRRGFPQLLCAS